MVTKGLIVYFDGPDGVGKTTQLQLAAQQLKDAGHEVHVIRAIGGSTISDALSVIMMSDESRPPETDFHIALAAQYASLQDIESRRNSGQIILVDRSPLSMIAYQVFAGGLDPDQGYHEVSKLLEKVNPDLILLFNASPQTRLSRRQSRNQQTGENYFEKMPPAYHDETAKGYAEAAQRLGATVIDSEPQPEAIHESVMQQILTKLQA